METEEEKKTREEEERQNLGIRYSCRKCGSVMKFPIGANTMKCTCGSSDLEFISKEYYTKSQYEYALEQFKQKNLLELIKDVLSESHIGDNDLKMTNFLVSISSLLNNPKRRMSQAVTGNSSEGKDNLIKTSLKHIPRDVFMFLTSGTQATIEDDIKGKRLIAFSEVNAGRENGANKFLVEVIKQVTEGGTSSIKKDIRTGMRTARHDEGEQMSVLFGTTESSMDEEMQTRFIKGTIETDPVRIKKVNDNTFDTFSDLDKLLNDAVEEDSWIRIGLTKFFNEPDQPEIYLPYAKFLKEQIGGKDIFDHNNPRSQRDIKRVLALTCAMTYLFQEQRQTIEHNGQKVLVSEYQDLINTLEVAGQFFNQSYSGLDKRLSNVLSIIESKETEWVARDDIQSEMDIKRKVTIKTYCQTLSEEGLIEGCSGKELNEISDLRDDNGFKLKVFNGNKIYYKRVQKGAKKPLIRVQINELKTFLEEKIKNSIAPFSSPCNSDDKNQSKRGQSKGVKKGVKDENSGISDENRPFEIAPLNKPEFSKQDYKKAGYSDEEIKEIQEELKDVE